MASRRTKVTKIDKDILESLAKEYPNMNNPTRLRTIFDKYQEFRCIEKKVKKANEFLYGKYITKRANAKKKY